MVGVMRIIVNGEARDVDAATVERLLEVLRLPRERVAVEQNGVIVMKAARGETPVCENDVFEIVTLVGGG